jgi:subtilisin family serine protease
VFTTFPKRSRRELLIMMMLEACGQPTATSKTTAVVSSQVDGHGGGEPGEAAAATSGLNRSVYNLTGRGVRVAVVDTGVDLTHPDLQDAVVAQHCFVTAGCQPLPASEGTNAQDSNGHGTNVAGVIASRGKVGPAGFATEAEIVAVKAGPSSAEWVAGLNWLSANQATLKLQIVVLGIGADMLFGQKDCDTAASQATTAIGKLVDAGVTVFAAAGDKGSPTQLATPACNMGSIAVGASYGSALGPQPSGLSYSIQYGTSFANCKDQTTAADQITCFSNSGPRLDLVAPGAAILTDALGGGTATVSSTTEAAAAAAGIAALMLQCNPSLTPADIKAALIDTGVKQTDKKNTMSYPVVRALDAVRKVCPSLAADAGVPSTTDAGATLSDGDSGANTRPGMDDSARGEGRLGERYRAGVTAPALTTGATSGESSSSPGAAGFDGETGNDASAAGAHNTHHGGGCSSVGVGAHDLPRSMLGLATLFGSAFVMGRRARRVQRRRDAIKHLAV